MEFLKLLEAHRNPILDKFFSAITYFGDEVLILGVAFIILWCMNKRMGYTIIYSVMLGVTFNQFLKGIFCIPRPWVRDPSFTIVEEARAAATGYSFPSGHTQNSTVMFGSVARSIKNRIIRILMIVLILLIGFSRMYLGVHTPADVITSWILGTLLVLGVYPFLSRAENNRTFGILLNLFFLAISILLVVFTELSPVGVGEAAKFAAEGVTNAYTILGVAAAFPIVWYLDAKKLKYDVKAVWWAQILKCLLGVAIVFGLRIGLKPVLAALVGSHNVGTAIRYFILALFGGTVWPLTFRFWGRLGRQRGNNLH